MTPARWRPRLAQTLDAIAEAAPHFRDDWWIIGSAAAALAGAEIVDVHDVDLLLSEDDARKLIDYWAGARPRALGASDQFRSAVFARFDHTPLPIEVMAGFDMRVRGKWRRIEPMTRVDFSGYFAPSVAEQIALLEAMAREKDCERARLLRRCL